MKLEEIQHEWASDSQIDRTELGNEAAKIPQLHSKYYKMYSNERLLLRKMEGDSRILYRDLWEYYQGNMDYEQLQEYGWSQQPLKILKADLNTYIDANESWISSNLKLAYQREKVEFLESCIKSLNNRGFNINAAISWEKFKIGI